MVAGCGGIWVRRWMEGYGYGCAYGSSVGLWGIESIRMVFQRSECSSYRCDGSFRKLCSATCICAFTMLPMIAAHVPTLCTLSATCLRFPRRCCFCVRSQRCSARCLAFPTLFTEGARATPEKKWGALGACHALNAPNARIFFSRCQHGHARLKKNQRRWSA
jgi:hypothetical protein